MPVRISRIRYEVSDQASGPIRRIGEANRQVATHADHAARSLQGLERASQQGARAAHGHRNAMSDLGMAMMMTSNVGGRAMGVLGGAISVGLGMGVVGGIVAAGAAILGTGKAMITLAGEADVLERRFQTLTHSLEQGTALFAAVQRFADETPLSDPAAFRGAETLLNFGFAAGEIVDTMRDLGDAVAGNEERFHRASVAFGQILAKGRLSAEEALQLAEAGIPAYAILQEQLGLSAKAMQNLGNAGIPARRAIEALRAGMQARFGGGMAAMADTVPLLESNVAAAWQRMLRFLGRGFDPLVKDSLRWLIDSLRGLGEAAQRLTAGGLWSAFVASFQRLGQALAPAVPLLGKLLGLLGLGLLAGLTIAAEGLALAFRGIGAALQFVGWVTKPFLDVLAGLWQRLKVIDWGGMWQAVKQWASNVAAWLGEQAQPVLDALRRWAEWAADKLDLALGWTFDVAVPAAWTTVIQPALRWLQETFWPWAADKLQRAWSWTVDVAVPAAWTTVIAPTLTALQTFWDWAGPLLERAWHWTVGVGVPAWWERDIAPVLAALRLFWDWAGDKAQKDWLWGVGVDGTAFTAGRTGDLAALKLFWDWAGLLLSKTWSWTFGIILPELWSDVVAPGLRELKTFWDWAGPLGRRIWTWTFTMDTPTLVPLAELKVFWDWAGPLLERAWHWTFGFILPDTTPLTDLEDFWDWAGLLLERAWSWTFDLVMGAAWESVKSDLILIRDMLLAPIKVANWTVNVAAPWVGTAVEDALATLQGFWQWAGKLASGTLDLGLNLDIPDVDLLQPVLDFFDTLGRALGRVADAGARIPAAILDLLRGIGLPISTGGPGGTTIPAGSALVSGGLTRAAGALVGQQQEDVNRLVNTLQANPYDPTTGFGGLTDIWIALFQGAMGARADDPNTRQRYRSWLDLNQDRQISITDFSLWAQGRGAASNVLPADLFRTAGTVAMQAGGVGVVSRPTTFLAGEAGPEAFAFRPLGGGGPAGGGGSVTVNVTLQGGVYATREALRELAQAVGRETVREFRLTAPLALSRV